MINSFDELVALLKENGYKTEVIDYKEFRFCKVIGRGIKGGFCTESRYVYSDIDNTICVDHISCFDKWSKCPIKMTLPLNEDTLLEYMNFLASEEGFKNSNSYDYLDNDLYPYKGENNGKK